MKTNSIFAYFIYLISSIFAVDRITLNDGRELMVFIRSQDKEKVVFDYQGSIFSRPKEQIKTIKLDVDIDKYYLAAIKSKDYKKKGIYLKKYDVVIFSRRRAVP